MQRRVSMRTSTVLIVIFGNLRTAPTPSRPPQQLQHPRLRTRGPEHKPAKRLAGGAVAMRVRQRQTQSLLKRVHRRPAQALARLLAGSVAKIKIRPPQRQQLPCQANLPPLLRAQAKAGLGSVWMKCLGHLPQRWQDMQCGNLPQHQHRQAEYSGIMQALHYHNDLPL